MNISELDIYHVTGEFLPNGGEHFSYANMARLLVKGNVGRSIQSFRDIGKDDAMLGALLHIADVMVKKELSQKYARDRIQSDKALATWTFTEQLKYGSLPSELRHWIQDKGGWSKYCQPSRYQLTFVRPRKKREALLKAWDTWRKRKATPKR